MEKFLKSPINKFMIWIAFGLIVCFIGIINTKALTITDYSTKYYYCVTSSSGDQCGSTNYRSGASNQLTMDGTNNYPPTYDKFDIFTGMYNQINMQVSAGSTYTFTIEVVYSNLSESEFNSNTLSRFNQFKGTNNGIVNNVSYTYSRRSIQDGLSGYYEYRILITYTLTPSSNASTIYLGSYTTSGYTFGFNQHQYRTLVYVASINVDVNNDSTIINQNNTIINQNQEAQNTRVGILGKIGDLISYINPTSENFFVYKLIDLLKEALQWLFVPSGEYLNNWYSDFRDYFQTKFGFLSTPIVIFGDFINLYLNLEEGNIIINIPDIYVPNFEENKIISATTFNWSELLNSKPSLQTLWNLYLDFIDVFMILNFLGLCEVTLARIIGGNTQEYEYYTTEDVYLVNDDTGEATNHQLRQRRTRREKR